MDNKCHFRTLWIQTCQVWSDLWCLIYQLRWTKWWTKSKHSLNFKRWHPFNNNKILNKIQILLRMKAFWISWCPDKISKGEKRTNGTTKTLLDLLGVLFLSNRWLSGMILVISKITWRLLSVKTACFYPFINTRK